MDTFAPAKILAELMAHSIDFLAAEWSDVPVRQRNMRAVLDSSWRLLAAHERAVFASLSVFQGGLSMEAAQSVAGASPRDLRSLTDKSLLRSVAPGGYELHELLRQYAAEHLARAPNDIDAALDRHAAYYTAVARSRARISTDRASRKPSRNWNLSWPTCAPPGSERSNVAR